MTKDTKWSKFMEIYFAEMTYYHKKTGEQVMRMSHHTISVIADDLDVAEFLIDKAIEKENEKLPSLYYTPMYVTRGKVKKCDYMIFSSHEDWSAMYYHSMCD
jgi:hypothetical protein